MKCLQKLAFNSLFCCIFLTPLNAMATIQFEGNFTQGGLIKSQVEVGSKVWLGDQKVPVLKNGSIIFGFGRDHPKSATLKITSPNGQISQHQFDITPRHYKIQRINGLPKSKVKVPRSKALQTRISNEIKAIGNARAELIAQDYFSNGFIWPSKGRISGVYGSQRVLNGIPKRPHFGVDIAAKTGTPVVAPAGGVVKLVQKDNYFSGGTMIIDHGYRLSSAFLHMHSFDVKTGDIVKQGQKVGTIGSTGRATGPHLDWRMNWFNKRIDPELLVPKGGNK